MRASVVVPSARRKRERRGLRSRLGCKARAVIASNNRRPPQIRPGVCKARLDSHAFRK